MLITKNSHILILSTVVLVITASENDFCEESTCDNNITQENFRFLLYDVNPPEGFNLRRDVYMRFAILAHSLKKSKNLNNFKLVLPPWSRLYHWKYNPEPERLPWRLFFDTDSMKLFAPVIEMYDFFDAMGKKYSIAIDSVYVLQHFKHMFASGKFVEKMKIEEQCSPYVKPNYFFYENITSKDFKCLSFHGPATKLTEILSETEAKTVMFHHAEIALHDMFGDRTYWQCRRSMRFNKELQGIAADFRKQFLNSTDEEDNTVLPEDWRNEKSHRSAKGGPYLSVHVRRRDFVKGRPDQVPTIDSIAKQIVDQLKKLELNVVFFATDATDEEYRKLIQLIPSDYIITRYMPNEKIKTKFKDGGIAIVDQILCSHSRYFIGTHESTFSFRIQEEREIMGFPTDTTFNCFCKNDENCPQPSVWKIVY